jgi:hypothetical protein
MSDEEVKVGNVGKTTKKPVPGKAVKAETTISEASGDGDGIAELNIKMDKMLEFMQAIDWKMWVYLKANNYID